MKSSPLKPPEPAVSSREKELEVSFWKEEDICELDSSNITNMCSIEDLKKDLNMLRWVNGLEVLYIGGRSGKLDLFLLLIIHTRVV